MKLNINMIALPWAKIKRLIEGENRCCSEYFDPSCRTDFAKTRISHRTHFYFSQVVKLVLNTDWGCQYYLAKRLLLAGKWHFEKLIWIELKYEICMIFKLYYYHDFIFKWKVTEEFRTSLSKAIIHFVRRGQQKECHIKQHGIQSYRCLYYWRGLWNLFF